MVSLPSTSTIAVVGIVIAAAIFDLGNRRIPNALTLGAAGIAVALHGVTSGWSGVLLAASGWAVGLALFFPLFALGGMGAGDVKLLAAIGAWMGPTGVIWTGLYGAVAGGIMALVFALAGGYARSAMRNVVAVMRLWRVEGVRPIEGLTLANKASVKLPYAVPLAAGALATLWLH
jgi:prepilin peptidase CpaA